MATGPHLSRCNVKVDIDFWIERLVRKEVGMKVLALLHVRCHVKAHPAGRISCWDNVQDDTPTQKRRALTTF